MKTLENGQKSKADIRRDKDMVYGVVVVHDTNDYSKMTMKVWRNSNATLLMNKGCEAVFITESSAHSYAYEQAEMRSIECDQHTYDVNWLKEMESE